MCFAKCCRYSASYRLVVHPDACAIANDSGGALSRKSLHMRTRGKTKAGGIKLPAAFILHTSVAVLPHSALTILPTLFMPANDSILGSLVVTVETPVSSTL